MIYVVGGAGFVGSAIVRYIAERGWSFDIIERDDLDRFKGTACDILIDANGNSFKPLAERDPLREFDASVRGVAERLDSIDATHYVFLSSGDVYPDPSRPDLTMEDGKIDVARLSRYGLHKFLAEGLVRSVHPRWLILRLGGMVGLGLKKNVVFDMMMNQSVWLTPESELQFISTDTVARTIFRLLDAGARSEVVNVAGRGRQRVDDLFNRIGSGSFYRPDARYLCYELSTDKLTTLLGEPPPSSATELDAFLLQHQNLNPETRQILR